MGPTLQPNLQLLYNDARLSSLLDALDELHTAASEDRLSTVSTLSKAELKSWLYEIIYTASEAMNEIDNSEAGAAVALELVRKTS